MGCRGWELLIALHHLAPVTFPFGVPQRRWWTSTRRTSGRAFSLSSRLSQTSSLHRRPLPCRCGGILARSRLAFVFAMLIAIRSLLLGPAAYLLSRHVPVCRSQTRSPRPWTTVLRRRWAHLSIRMPNRFDVARIMHRSLRSAVPRQAKAAGQLMRNHSILCRLVSACPLTRCSHR